MSNRVINAIGVLLGMLAVGVPAGVYLRRMLRVPAGQKQEAGR